MRNFFLSLAVSASMINTLSFAQEQNSIDWNKELLQHLEIFNGTSLAARQDLHNPFPVSVPVVVDMRTPGGSTYFYYDINAKKYFEVTIPGLKLTKDVNSNARFIHIQTNSDGQLFNTAMHIGFDSMLSVSSMNYVDQGSFQRAKQDRFNDYPLLDLKGHEVTPEKVVRALRREISNSFSSIFPNSKHRISDSLLESAREIINGSNIFGTDKDKKQEAYGQLAQKTLQKAEKLLADLGNVSERSFDSKDFILPIHLVRTEIKLIKHLTQLTINE